MVVSLQTDVEMGLTNSKKHWQDFVVQVFNEKSKKRLE